MVKKPSNYARSKSALGVAASHVCLVANNTTSYSDYCLFAPGWLIGYDGVVAAGYRVAEHVTGAVEAVTLQQALARAGEPYSLTALPDGSLIVRGSSVRVRVPGTSPAAIPNVQPDAPLMAFTNPAIGILEAVAKITAARAPRVIQAAVLLRSDSVVATSGDVLLEGHHGLGLPGQWLLPCEFIEVLRRCKFAATHCGWSDTTFTVWFGPLAWLRTNLYEEKYPDTDIVFARMIADLAAVPAIVMPEDCLLAVETLRPFLTDKALLVDENGFNTQTDGAGASYRIAHNFPKHVAPFEGIRQAAAHAHWIGFTKDAAYWYGEKIRGGYSYNKLA